MQDIGWDAYLERCWNEHTDEQDSYELRQHIEEIEAELRRLDEEWYEAEADGRTADATAIESQIETLQNELDGIFHR